MRFSKGKFPNSMKTDKIIPIIPIDQKDDKLDCNSYRPVLPN